MPRLILLLSMLFKTPFVRPSVRRWNLNTPRRGEGGGEGFRHSSHLISLPSLGRSVDRSMLSVYLIFSSHSFFFSFFYVPALPLLPSSFRFGVFVHMAARSTQARTKLTPIFLSSPCLVLRSPSPPSSSEFAAWRELILFFVRPSVRPSLLQPARLRRTCRRGEGGSAQASSFSSFTDRCIRRKRRGAGCKLLLKTHI